MSFDISVGYSVGSSNYIVGDDLGITWDLTPDTVTSISFSVPVGSAHVAALDKHLNEDAGYENLITARWRTDTTAPAVTDDCSAFRLVGRSVDLASENPSITYTGQALSGDLSRAVILQAPGFVPPVRELGEFDQHYPRSWEAGTSVGTVVGELLNEAVARGELSGYTVQTSGATLTLPAVEEVQTFSELGSFLSSLAQRGLVTVRVWVTAGGKVITAMNPGSRGRDVSSTVTLGRGRDLDQLPSERSNELVANRVYVRGDDATWAAVDAPGAVAPWRSVTIEASGVKDQAGLREAGARHLRELGRQRKQVTLGVACAVSAVVPFRDFTLMDTVTVAAGDGVAQKLQVKQITVKKDGDDINASVVVGDRWEAPEITLMRHAKDGRLGGRRALGSRGPLVRPATSVRPGTKLRNTPYTYEQPDGTPVVDIGPDGIRVGDPEGERTEIKPEGSTSYDENGNVKSPPDGGGGDDGGGGTPGEDPRVDDMDTDGDGLPNVMLVIRSDEPQMRPAQAAAVYWIGNDFAPGDAQPGDLWMRG